MFDESKEVKYFTEIQISRPWVKSVQIRSFFWSVFSCIPIKYGDLLSSNTGKYGSEETPYLDTFHAVRVLDYRIEI